MAAIFIFLLFLFSSIKLNLSKPGVLNFDLLPKVYDKFNMTSHLDFLHIKKVCSSRYSICKSNDTKVCGMRYFLNEEQFEDFDNTCFMFLSNMCDTPGNEYYIVSSGNCRDYFFENLKKKRKARRDDNQDAEEETTDQNKEVTNPEQESEVNTEATENDENNKENPEQEGNEANKPEDENIEATEQEITESQPNEATEPDNEGENIEGADKKDDEGENREQTDKKEDEAETSEEENTDVQEEGNITENEGDIEGNTEGTEQSGGDGEPVVNTNEEGKAKPNGEGNDDNNTNNDVTTQVDYAFIEPTEETEPAVTTPAGKFKYVRAKQDAKPAQKPPPKKDDKGKVTPKPAKKPNAKPDEKKPDGKKPDGKKTDGKKPDGKKPDEKKPDGKKPDGKKPDGKKPDGKKPDEKNTTQKPGTTAKKMAAKKTTRFTLYSIDTAFDDHICPLSCPTTYSPVCVSANRGYGIYFKFYTFINHCLGDLYYCQHWKEFAPPPDESEMVISSPLSWSFCGASRYIQFARFAEVASSMGHYGWLAGDYRPTHIMEPHERVPGYG